MRIANQISQSSPPFFKEGSADLLIRIEAKIHYRRGVVWSSFNTKHRLAHRSSRRNVRISEGGLATAAREGMCVAAKAGLPTAAREGMCVAAKEGKPAYQYENDSSVWRIFKMNAEFLLSEAFRTINARCVRVSSRVLILFRIASLDSACHDKLHRSQQCLAQSRTRSYMESEI